MPTFSQRMGLSPAQKALQRDVVDSELRNGLWTLLKVMLWDIDKRYKYAYSDPEPDEKVIGVLVTRLWIYHFKRPIDTLPHFQLPNSGNYLEIFRKHFFECEWNKLYEFLEFVIQWIPDEWAEKLIKSLNVCLAEENSAYRFQGKLITPITDETELAAIDDAAKIPNDEVKSHLTRALELLSDRKNPDYRNSIKESISAVEAICQRVSRKPDATLGDCLKALKEKCPIHPAFEAGMSKLYGYTNDSGGIRHALAEGDAEPSFAEAKFMLVAASAFVNFIVARSIEVGIKFK